MRRPSEACWMAAALLLVGILVGGCRGLDPAVSVRLADRLNPFAWHRTARTHFVQTEDGWTLALERRSPTHPLSSAPPVVLAHGFGYNGAFWSPDPTANLPGQLAAAGFDVWVLHWRGAGDSTKWVFKFPELAEEFKGWRPRRAGGTVGRLKRLSDARLANVTTEARFFSWSMDDHVKYDVPAVLDYISTVTGHPTVHWVGHSMGGNVALAYLATAPEEASRFAGLVTIGSQVTMPANRLFGEYLKELAASRGASFKGVTGITSALAGAAEPAQDLFFRTANVDGAVLERLSEAASDPPGLGVLAQYLELVGSGELKSADKTINYSRLMGRVSVPILITAGAADRLAPPVVQRHLFRSVGSQDKRLVLFGTGEGFSTDYGHGDPIVGRSAPQDVYPILIEWLRTHS